MQTIGGEVERGEGAMSLEGGQELHWEHSREDWLGPRVSKRMETGELG